MTPEEFVASFETVADAPDGVKSLRRAICNLAIRGKLAPQQSKDEFNDREPVSENSPMVPTLPDLPFEIPVGWRWSCLGDVCSAVHYGYTAPSMKAAGDARLLRITDIQNDCVDWAAVPGCKIDSERIATFGLSNGDLLIARTGGTIGKTYLVQSLTTIAVFASYLIRAVPRERSTAEYLKLFTRSDLYWRQLRAGTAGTGQPNVNATTLRGLLIPMPPSSEQKRIVAKVDKLMALCDDLEARQAKKRETAVRLNRAALDALTSAEGPEEVAASFRRVAENFEELIHTSESVGELRNTILDLAVQGKLTQRDLGVESAADFIRRIAGGSGTSTELGDIEERTVLDAPYELPSSWAWARFPELGEFGRGRSKHRPRNDPSLYRGGKYPFVQTGDVARSNGIVRTYSSVYNDMGLAQSKLWPPGTMCITIAANIADTGILTFAACFPDSVVGFIPSPLFADARYFEYFLRTAKQRIERFAPATAQKNINLEILSNVFIPLPPPTEMARIVAKVDQLMALCDTLEAALRRAETTAQKLAEAVVAELVA